MADGISSHVDRAAAKVKNALATIALHIATRLHRDWKFEKPVVEKADPEEQARKLIAAAVQADDFILFQQLLTPELARQFQAAGYAVAQSFQLLDDERLVTHMDTRAHDYAEERGAELVGKQVRIAEDGTRTVVDNPNPKWSITDSTRELLTSTVKEGIEEGWSSQRLADEIAGNFAFSESRSLTIARTELAFAHVAGHADVARETGAVGKRSILGSEHDHDVPEGDQCDEAEEAGVIGIDEEFIPGYMGPPYHPNCVCDVEMIYSEDPRAADLVETEAADDETDAEKIAKSLVDDAAHAAATSPLNALPAPSDAQIKAGTYKKGHIKVAGIDIAIENPVGSRRKPHFPPLKSHYGYIKRTEGADGDEIDVFVKEGIEADYAGPVWVVYQPKLDGTFDEHKCLMGWITYSAAKDAYLDNYTADWRMGEMRRFTLDEFKVWLQNPT